MSKRKRGQDWGKASKAELRHEEIWDDSELVNSWNEALREYKKYHSLHARGEMVEDVLKKAKAEEAITAAASPGGLASASQNDAEYNNGEGEEEDEDEGEGEAETINMEDEEYYEPEEDGGEACVDKAVASSASAPPQNGDVLETSAALPQAVLEDSPLKSLMMSWYYAGYYTGLYEGQQKAAQERTEQTAHASNAAKTKNGHG